jgi:dephospho-CoA kinase
MMIPFVGLTGGIGSGKSTALAALGRLGAATLSTDAVVHELYGSSTLRDAVVQRFGPDVAPNGVVDRTALAGFAFSDPEQRQWLEGLLWPLVGERMWSWRQALEGAAQPPRVAVVEVPLLFEAGMESGFDATITVIAEESVRSARAGARGHAAVDERTSRQLTQEEKAARSTYVVDNDGSEADLESKLSDVLDMLAP